MVSARLAASASITSRRPGGIKHDRDGITGDFAAQVTLNRPTISPSDITPRLILHIRNLAAIWRASMAIPDHLYVVVGFDLAGVAPRRMSELVGQSRPMLTSAAA
jgi:hypothetical protein